MQNNQMILPFLNHQLFLQIEKESEMLKLSILAVIFISAFLPQNLPAQESNSLQVSGGIISPMSSSHGLSGTLQFNYSINPDINFYVYSGYASWDNHYLKYHEDYSPIQHQQYFKIAAESNHTMIPVYFGARWKFHTIKLFSSFIEIEAGYTNLDFVEYKIDKIVNPETGEVVYQRDGTIQYDKNEDLLGIGIGAGLSHPITNNFNLIFEFKLNSHINSDYYGLFSTRGTYTRFIGGFSFNI